MRYDNGGNTNMMLPHGVDLTLSELQEMAARQQQQIEAQQQQLVAKEQRLRFLKQQELRHEQIAAENERLRKLREKVESQELKLKKLRALRGQVSEHKGNNNNLTAELEMIKSLFNEKEKELSMAVTKVEELTKQLEELRNGRINGLQPGNNRNNSPAFLELEKLRKELMVRNKLNEAQNSKLAAHREVMVQRKEEMSDMDVRIAELQQRLRKNRNLQQQQHNNQQAGIGGQRGGSLNAKIGLNRPLSANIAAVEPYMKHGSSKDIVPDQHGYNISKQDPKYQTLPPNIKLLGLQDGKWQDTEANGNGGLDQQMDNDHLEKNNNNQQYQQTGRQELKVDTNQGVSDANLGQGSPGRVATDLLSKDTVHNVPDFKPSKGHTTAFAVMEQVLKKSEKIDGGKSVPPRGGVYGPSAYKPPSSLSNFTARPFGSTYSTAMLANRPSITSTQSTPIPTNSVSSPGAVFPKTSTPIAAAGYSNHKDDMMEIFITGAPASASTSLSARPSTYTPAAPGNVTHNYPPVTISTSNVMANPVPSSELSPKPGSMQYQIATSRPQQAMFPQRAGNLPSPQSTLRDQQLVKQAPPSQVPASRGNITISSGNFKSTTAGEGRPNAPGQIGISLSTKVTLSERHALDPNADSNTSLGNQGSASLANQGSNSPGSPNDVLQYPESTSLTDIKKDITPNSVSSALSVLMSGPTTTVAATRPYRYAPKSVIANTYMRKLGSNTLDEYRKTMNQIYKDFSPATSSSQSGSGDTNSSQGNSCPGPMAEAPRAGEPDMAPGPRSPPGGAQLRAVPIKAPNSFSNTDNDGPLTSPSQSGIPPYQRAANHEMEAERLRYNANAPKMLRRRLSSGESDDLAHLTPKAQYTSVPDKISEVSNSSQTHSAPSEDDVVRVDTIQDSYNNNTGFSDDVKGQKMTAPGFPYNAPHGDGETLLPAVSNPPAVQSKPAVIRRKKTNLKIKGSTSSSRRVSFDPLALLLDASLEGELELVKRTATEVSDPSAANDEGITALHNAICAGHYDIVKFLTEFGCNVNAPDSDGWTPLHCAASCNNLAMVKLLVEHGACIFATTISDQETAAEKCEEDEDGYDGCSEYLYSIQEKLGIVNKGVVYAVFDYKAQNPDELSFRDGNNLTVLRKGDEQEKDWWWARSGDREGYIPRNLLGSFPRVPLQSAYDSRVKER